MGAQAFRGQHRMRSADYEFRLRRAIGPPTIGIGLVATDLDVFHRGNHGMYVRRPTVPKKANVTMGRARASVAVAIAALVLIGGCSADKSSPHTRQSVQPKDPQRVLDEASKRVVDAGTGNFNVSVDGMDVSIEGTYDLGVPYISQELAAHPPDLGADGFKVRYVLIKKKVFARVSEGPFRKCWMRFTPIRSRSGTRRLQPRRPGLRRPGRHNASCRRAPGEAASTRLRRGQFDQDQSRRKGPTCAYCGCFEGSKRIGQQDRQRRNCSCISHGCRRRVLDGDVHARRPFRSRQDSPQGPQEGRARDRRCDPEASVRLPRLPRSPDYFNGFRQRSRSTDRKPTKSPISTLLPSPRTTTRFPCKAARLIRNESPEENVPEDIQWSCRGRAASGLRACRLR